MINQIIVDTGPLVALLDKSDSYHQWITEKVKTLSPPFLTCDAEITESCFLLERDYNSHHILFSLLESGHLHLAFNLKDELTLDSDFLIYPQNKNQSIPVIFPHSLLL